MARSDVDHIISWKGRRGQARIGTTITNEVQRIAQFWSERRDSEREFIDFIPMRLVTIIEVFFREIIREIVDNGQPYIDRAEKLVRGAKIDFIFASNVHVQKLSIGDIVAHSVPFSNPTQIISYMSGLIPDYVQRLRVSHPRWSEEKASWPQAPIISNYDVTLGNLAKLFEIRHILTHEIPSKPVYDIRELDALIASTADFLDATDWVVIEVLRGETPQTQTAMNSQAGNDLRTAEQEMVNVIAAIKTRGEVEHSLIDKFQEAWNAYADREADMHASLVEGGSMYPLVWASAKAEVVDQRIKSLRWWISREEGIL